jgi:hypothetical protein
MEEIVISRLPKEVTKLKNYRNLGRSYRLFEKIENNILQTKPLEFILHYQ